MIELNRATFATSRLLEFFSEPELTKQIGHPIYLWPVAILKELADNALDACEAANVPTPKVEVEIGDDFFSVADNGPGIPPDTVAGSLDYAIRVSDKSYYVSPTRGQQGNALKTLWAAPFVFHNAPATIEVAARGVRHTVAVSLDRIAGAPKIEHSTIPEKVKSGTFWRVAWPELTSYLAGAESDDFYSAESLLAAFSAANPHAQFVLRHSGRKIVYSHNGDAWRKWPPNRPTSAHWYRPSDLQSLIAAYVHHDGKRGAGKSVRQFVGEFDGLTGSKRQSEVVAAAGLNVRQTLADMVAGDDVDLGKVSALLAAMQAEARPVKPSGLGVVGKPWFESRLVELFGAAAESVRYKRACGTADGLPFVLEVGFGVHRADAERDGRRVVVALNWSPAIRNPIDELDDLLQEKRVDSFDDVTMLVHLAYPRLNYRDRGKASLTLPDEIEDALMACVESVAKEHHKEKRRADKDDRLSMAALDRLRKTNQPKKVDLTEVAFSVMEAAYKQVSGPNNMPANARQIMYVVRPFVMERCGKCWKHSSYFTQKLLPSFIKANPELTADWDVVFDARGHFVEPHTGRTVNLGTIGVREYIADWTNIVAGNGATIDVPRGVATCGPAHRYRFALFVEKEGFGPHLEYARIAERFDVAVMSTKGLSNTASRRLVEDLSEAGVTILVLRDFDVSGFTIVHTLRTDTDRYQFKTAPNVCDLGLRLPDARKMGLRDEQVTNTSDPRPRLARCGATEKEQAFLVSGGSGKHWTGKRIELNAMTSEQFIDYVERKLRAAGAAEKVVPSEKTLRRAYRLAAESHYIRGHSAELLAAAQKHAKSAKLPGDLAKRVARYLKANPAASWDEALAGIVEQEG